MFETTESKGFIASLYFRVVKIKEIPDLEEEKKDESGNEEAGTEQQLLQEKTVERN
jgi:hypothetical protein